MAESILLHFRGTSSAVVAAVLDEVAHAMGGEAWIYPEAEAEVPVPVTIYRYDEASVLHEYEPDALARLVAALGGTPTTSWAIEMRRSEGARAADAAAEVARALLARLDGVVDDCAGRLWTAADIDTHAQGARVFLDCYRHPTDGG